MKVLDIKVEWMHKFSNNPSLKLLVDKMPEIKDLIYTHKNNYEKDGYVSYHYCR